MPTADYWNNFHGLDVGEINQDIEGIEVVQKLARNMAWIMKVIEASKGKIDPPETKPRTMTNLYVRSKKESCYQGSFFC